MSGDNFGFKGSKGNHQRSRKYSGGGPRPDSTDLKRAEAAERIDAWQKLSPKEQLAALDRRLGVGSGAKRQRGRLVAAIERRVSVARPAEPATNDQVVQGGRIKAKERRAEQQAKRPSK